MSIIWWERSIDWGVAHHTRSYGNSALTFIDGGLGDVPDGGRLHDVADDELLDRLVLGRTAGAVRASTTRRESMTGTPGRQHRKIGKLKKNKIQFFLLKTSIVDQFWHFCIHLQCDKPFAKTGRHAVGEKTDVPFFEFPYFRVLPQGSAPQGAALRDHFMNSMTGGRPNFGLIRGRGCPSPRPSKMTTAEWLTLRFQLRGQNSLTLSKAKQTGPEQQDHLRSEQDRKQEHWRFNKVKSHAPQMHCAPWNRCFSHNTGCCPALFCLYPWSRYFSEILLLAFTGMNEHIGTCGHNSNCSKVGVSSLLGVTRLLLATFETHC